jgi:hypothetical protein
MANSPEEEIIAKFNQYERLKHGGIPIDNDTLFRQYGIPTSAVLVLILILFASVVISQRNSIFSNVASNSTVLPPLSAPYLKQYEVNMLIGSAAYSHSNATGSNITSMEQSYSYLSGNLVAAWIMSAKNSTLKSSLNDSIDIEEQVYYLSNQSASLTIAQSLFDGIVLKQIPVENFTTTSSLTPDFSSIYSIGLRKDGFANYVVIAWKGSYVAVVMISSPIVYPINKNQLLSDLSGDL